MSDQTRANPQELDCHRLAELLGGDWALGNGALYRRLADRIDTLITNTELRNGVRLPAERLLAASLDVSRSTVVAALDLLRERGSVVSKRGSGTRVVGPTPPNTSAAAFQSRSLFIEGSESIELNMAVPNLLPTVREIYANTVGALPLEDMGTDPEGSPELRQAIAQRYTDEGLATAPEDIMVTSGAQQGIGLALSVLCRPGDVVLTEAYTWPGLTDYAARLGARCYGVAMDAGGIDTRELRSAVERLRPSVIALNPHHQNPTATRLLPHRRREVADIAADYGVALLEDRVAARLAFDDVVEPPLAALRPDAQALTTDSLCKVAWPGLRLGWLRVPRGVMAELRLAKAIRDLYTSALSQQLAVHLLARLDDLVAERVEQLRPRAMLAYDAIRTRIPDWEVTRPEGGMVLWPRLPGPDAAGLVLHAARRGVTISGADSFAVTGGAPDRIRIPFTTTEDQILEGIRRLGDAWDSLDRSAPLVRTAGLPVI